MKKLSVKLFIVLLSIVLVPQYSFADNYSKAQKYIKKAKLSSMPEQSYEFIHKARVLYEEELERNPANIDVLVGLSVVYQMIEDRAEAKLYVLKAYNMEPYNPKLQKAMGDFHYSFQEYSVAVEYYKLALSSGLLRDFDTNLQTAKCFEKLGDTENADLYYKISYHLDSSSKEAKDKVLRYEKPTISGVEGYEEPKYKYLFKDKAVNPEEQTEKEAEELVEDINNIF